MICRKCRADNPATSVYCVSCGQPLIRKPRAKVKVVPWYVFVASLCVLLFGGYFILKVVLPSSRKEEPILAAAKRGVAARTALSDKKDLHLIKGNVVVRDPEKRVISQRTSAVCDSNWTAFPVWPLLEGKTLSFQNAEGKEIPIEKGVWETGDPIILWKLETDKMANAPALMPWKQYMPLEWCSYLKEHSLLRVDVPSTARRGAILSFPLPEEIQEPGVFMQEGHIVGWTFPGEIEKGYLWAGPSGSELLPNIRKDRFFNSTIPKWREAHFHSVLSLGDKISAAVKLEVFSEGLPMHSPFSEEDVPNHLRSRTIANLMHTLAAQLIENGMTKDVVRILDESTLVAALNLALVEDAVLARIKSEDHNLALRFVERFKKSLFETKGQELSGLRQLHAALYKDWLRKILDQGSYYSGMVAFEEAKRAFPDDTELHLLGVEIAISERNWKRARELLQMRDYPESMRNWVSELENTIQYVQENEGAVTIRFIPGASHIPVKVFLNGTHSFRFIIDTGATMCSIPSIAVDRLRINIDQTTPVRLISTAGGIAETYEIKLKSIELGGFRVFDVKALIIDIPGYREYGLLGQNFLNSFHIEIDNQKGILRLKKR